MKRQALMVLLMTLAALAWAAPLTARQQSPATDQQSFLPPTATFIGRTAQIPMRDGQSLAADIYLPNVGGKHPVVLIQTPYNKTPMRSWWQGEGRWGANSLFTDPNYVFVVTDWRAGSWQAAEHRAGWLRYHSLDREAGMVERQSGYLGTFGVGPSAI